MHNTQLRDIAQVIKRSVVKRGQPADWRLSKPDFLSARSAGVKIACAGSTSFVKSYADRLVGKLPVSCVQLSEQACPRGFQLKKRGVYVHAT